MPPPIPPFQAFLEENRTLVYRYLTAAAGPHDADDLFQETFMAALRAYPRLADATNLRGWILTIATRKVIDAARARARRAIPMDELEDLAAPVGPAPSDGDGALWESVRSLPAKQRAAVVQRFVLDRSYGDIAEVMGSSEETVRANVYQGLQALRRRYADAS